MKKLIGIAALLLAATMLIAIAAIPAAAQSEGKYILGDTDGDGDITVLDATRIQRILAKLMDDPDGLNKLRGDINRDGLDIMDATAIQRYVAHFGDNTQIGEEFDLPSTPGETQAPTQAASDNDELPFVPV